MSSNKGTLLAQIAPQRSTQYADLASELAPAELLLSPLAPYIRSITPRTLGGQAYLEIALDGLADRNLAGEPSLNEQILDVQALAMLGSLAMTTAYFWMHDQVGSVKGPFLEPIETNFIPGQPPELITTRRYRGKTNELFTHWLCNVAKFSSDFASAPWESLTLVDPLAGGGTSLFVGLVLGAQTVAGIEQDQKDGKSTATFLKQFADEGHIPVRLKEERLKKLGKRWTLLLGEAPNLRAERVRLADADSANVIRNSADRQTFIWAQGDTTDARALLPGLRPHLIVADLPYGIQHQGKLITLLDDSLPVWSSMLRYGGAMALSWDATRFSTSQMHAYLEKYEELTILREPPYDQLHHRVDRVIKRRDVVIMQPSV